MNSVRASAVAGLTTAALLVATVALARAPRIDVAGFTATGSLPKGVTVSPDGTRLYVTNYGQHNRRNISVYDASDLHRIEEIDVPGIVVESAIAPDGRTLYVSNFTRSTVQFVDLATRTVTREVQTSGRNPKILVLSVDGRRLFAANWSSANVTEIDTATGTVVRTLQAGLNPRGMALTRDGKLFVANFFGHTIDVFEGATLGQHHRIERVCHVPRHLVLSPDEHTLYVSCLGSNELLAMNPDNGHIEHRVLVGSAPKAADVSSDGRFVFTANYGGSSVSVVDTTDWTARTLEIPLMDAASGIVSARTGTRFFVTGWYDDHLYAVEPAGSGPGFTITPAQRAFTLQRREYHRLHPAE